MWHKFCRKYDFWDELDMSQSFYCGNQAGRPETSTRTKDSSADDKKFASNIELKFQTPESFFLDQPLEEAEPDKSSESDRSLRQSINERN